MSISTPPHRLRAAIAAAIAFALGVTLAGCSFSKQEEPSPSASAKQTTGPITVVASLNQWGSLAARIGGNDAKVTSILSSTTSDAHDFEPTAQDVKTLHAADVVIVNGAGYDTWASKNLPSSVTLVSAADIVGAMDGDNPHLWFSRDARYAMADVIKDTFTQLRAKESKTFSTNLENWKKDEDALEQRIEAFGKGHDDLTYAATESVAYYLMNDMGFEDKTPSGYARAMASDSEPSAADIKDFQKLLDDGGAKLLVNNPQEENETTQGFVDIARKGKTPVLDVTEQMPGEYKDLTSWIEALFDTVEQDMGTCPASAKDCPTGKATDEAGDAANGGNTEQDRAIDEGDDD
ncbi:metal ABC transporter solute-binding protein, Zn/Mn family [uncultured Bifidobacterium sp.]|uniref:metal ABC transporter solute-binding protein, Zn/Mn family n=1 Tax=uncultured Bifidobacterium sp. TaxID=165187 RepID=UPI002583BC25|nr:zinc ABC transporter substrate-binding protein [uncultured Bifidobacterium sp.]MEE0654968.1 zinc ABC transporter substrate-binding protein [Bifidobacterium criceti]